MATVAEHVPFLHLCKLCQKISERKGKDKKAQPLSEFINYWQEFHKKLHATDSNKEDSFFPAMRLMLPQCERQRAAYGIKEFTLAKLLIEIFCLDKNGVDAQKLLNYKSPKSARNEAGDFASVAYFVLKTRSPEKGTLNVHNINFYLDSVATNNGSKSKEELRQDLLYLFRNTSALEQKWLIRIILKDMKLGMSENSILKVFHPDAIDLYNVTNSLHKVCVSLKDSSARLHEIEISLFTPFRPMLSEMALPNQAETLMHGNSFIIETKYDGERLQLHKDGSSYMYFSRGGFDSTASYGSSPLQGNLTPNIHKAFNASVENCILDGEIVIYSSKLNCIVSKGESADVQALRPDGEFAPCFCAFDVVLLNDRILSNCPLTERIALLKNVFTPIENKIRHTEQIYATTNEDVNDELNKAIEGRLEGIIVKDPQSIYKPNRRKKGGWLKVKPEYVEGVMDSLDLLIIGGYYGEGKRSNIISQFLLAVASNEQTNGDPKCFYSMAKVGSGYTMSELYEMSAKLSDQWLPFNPKRCPNYLVIGGGRKEQPDVIIQPSKSQVVQVKATEINRSKSFATNCTLRFPRVEKIRYDKSWRDCMTVAELEDLRNLAAGSLATRKSAKSEEEPSPKKQRVGRERTIAVAQQFRPVDTSDVQKVSELFKDKEICIIFSSLSQKGKIEKLIVEHGGKCVQNPGSSTFCVVCDKITAKIKNIISTKMYDVVECQWVERCIEKKQLIPWSPDDLHHATERTQEKLGEDFDKFGDSFKEDVTEEKLRQIFAKIDKKDWEAENMTTMKMMDLEETYFENSSPYRLFRKCWFYIKTESSDILKTKEDQDNRYKLLQLQLQLYGGNICDEIKDETTHILLLSNDEDMQSTQLRRDERSYVTRQWVEDCINAGELVDTKSQHSSDDTDCSDNSIFSY